MLSILDAVMFPSLQTLDFDNGSRPHSDGGGDSGALETPALPVLFQVKTHVFRIFHCHLFNDIVYIIRLCPFVEDLIAFIDDSSYRVMDSSLHRLYPPVSLRNLILDMQALLEMTDWMMMCRPNYTNWSSTVSHGMDILIPTTSGDFWMEWGRVSRNLNSTFLDPRGVVCEVLFTHQPTRRSLSLPSWRYDSRSRCSLNTIHKKYFTQTIRSSHNTGCRCRRSSLPP
jgi:hypothetical protein